MSELRDTPPKFITSLFNSKSSLGSDLYCLSLIIRISEPWLSEAFRSEYQSRASDQNVRALSELCFGSEYQSFSLQWVSESILVPVDLSKNRKHIQVYQS